MASEREMKDGFVKRGVLIRSKDTHRGANEGLNEREVHGLFEENSTAYGRKNAEATVKKRARQAGHK